MSKNIQPRMVLRVVRGIVIISGVFIAGLGLFLIGDAFSHNLPKQYIMGAPMVAVGLIVTGLGKSAHPRRSAPALSK